jgi:hypothetical protein
MSRAEVVQRLKGIEAGQLGTARSPLGSNKIKYNTSYYGRVVRGKEFKWCVVFQWWCFQKAGISTAIFPKSARVFAVRDWYKKRGRFYRKPMVGDLVIYSFSHIGFVEKLLSGNRIQTIEGNWNDRVVRRTHRADASDVSGYCRPDYHKVKPVQAAPPATSPGGRTEAIVRALPRLERNDKGADVRRLQGLLVANGHKLPGSTAADGRFDGEFGAETEREVVELTGSKIVDGAQWKKLLGV